MKLRKHRRIVLLMAIVTALNGGCVDLVTESVKDGVGRVISTAVANGIAALFTASTGE